MNYYLRPFILLLSTIASANVMAVPVDLSSWTAEGGGAWTLQSGNEFVTQTTNGSPGVYFNGANSQGNKFSAEVSVQTSSDDDFLGFVLGYNTGDINSNSAEYLLIDWKQSDQGGFFGGTSLAGLAISRVTESLGDDSGAWLHSNAQGVEELQRATNLGSTGWDDYTTYDFDLVFTSSLVEFYVDDVLELSVNSDFNDGSFGFYNYSQSYVKYGGITQTSLQLDVAAIPEPGSIMLLSLGLLGLIVSKRKNVV